MFLILDPYEGMRFLLFSMAIMWGILLGYAIARREAIKWLLSIQVAVSIILGIGWERINHHPYSVVLAIHSICWGVCVLGFFAELFLLAYQHWHKLSKDLCLLAVGASIIHIIVYFWIIFMLAASAYC